MTVAYRVCRRLENGDVVHVAIRDRQGDAEDLIRSLSECWPGDYTVEKLWGTDSYSPPPAVAKYSEPVH